MADKVNPEVELDLLGDPIHMPVPRIDRSEPVKVESPQIVPVPINPLSISDYMQLGNILVRAGTFKDTRSAEQAVAKVLAGRERGLPPIKSMTHVYVVNGKVSMSSALIGAQIRQHPLYDYAVVAHTDEACSIEFMYKNVVAGTSSFSMEDAQLADLVKPGSPWVKFPRNMLFARALTNGARWYCPDVFGGAIYTPDEVGAEITFDSTGEVESYQTPEPEAGSVIVTTPSSPSPSTGDGETCPVHGEVWFMKGRMKSFAHPIGETGKWCNQDQVGVDDWA